MASRQRSSADPESSNDVASDMHWALLALAPPLAVAMIFAMAGLICLWLDVLT
jgi:hypothetical protein